MTQLALDLRPRSLGEVIGQDSAKKAIQSFADKNYWPNVFLFHGPPGTGKTTLALIVAQMSGADPEYIHEINASTANGVDAARELADLSSSRPFTGQRRVIILNEAHRLTLPAQDALKDPMEKNSALWLLTTDEPEKISSAIRSRASAATFELRPLTELQMVTLCEQALIYANPTGTWQPQTDRAAEWMYNKGVREPREILGALDLFFSGVPIEQCIHGAEHEPLYKDVAGAVLRGDWNKASATLEQIKTADYRGMISIVSSFLGSALLKEPIGAKADALATCLVGLGNSNFADGIAYAATKGLLYKCSRTIGGIK